MKRILAKLVLAVMAVLSFSAVSAMAEEIKISAGGAPVDSIIKPITTSFEKATGDKINLIFGGATISFKVLDRGDSDVMFAGSSYDDLLAALKKEGYEPKDKSVYKVETVGKSQIFIGINKDNPLKSLTKEQIKGIFTGKIQSWKELGGNDEPIMVIISTQNPATMAVFKKMALDGGEYLKDNLDISSFDEVRNAIAANSGAIGFGPYASLNGEGSKLPQIPEFVRPLIAVTKGAPPAKVKRLYDFIKGDGQKYIKP